MRLIFKRHAEERTMRRSLGQAARRLTFPARPSIIRTMDLQQRRVMLACLVILPLGIWAASSDRHPTPTPTLGASAIVPVATIRMPEVWHTANAASHPSVLAATQPVGAVPMVFGPRCAPDWGRLKHMRDGDWLRYQDERLRRCGYAVTIGGDRYPPVIVTLPGGSQYKVAYVTIETEPLHK